MSLDTESVQYLNLLITNSLNSAHAERKFHSTITLATLKGKLELLTGGSMDTMKIELRNQDQEVLKKLEDDSLSLAELGVQSGMVLHVIDIPQIDEDAPDVAFNLTPEEYAKRDDSARSFLMKNKLGKYDEEKLKKKKEEEEKELKLAESISVGSRCEVSLPGAPPRRGEVKYVGKVHFQSGTWIGIHYDEPMGKNDGSVDGKKYFESKPKYGGFVRPSNVTVGDFPELGLEELDEI